MYYQNIPEEELKNKVAQAYFPDFDCTQIIGKIDFSVAARKLQTSLFEEVQSFLWAEAKKGNKADIFESFVQLILTIGKARTFDTHLPPPFLAAFDAEKIAFLPYNEVQDFFYQNDFNWNVAPSNHETKEFKQVYEKAKNVIEQNAFLFYFGNDDADLHTFIKDNFVLGKSETSKIKIDKNNFMIIYNKWLAMIKPSIIMNWEIAKKNGIVDGDFFLADLLARENETMREKLYVLLNKDHYELDRIFDDMGLFNSKKAFFNDKQKAHTQFWLKYERPPKEEYWDYIVNRRDLLVPQDVRERKGSFYTPQIWVELSQKYLADLLGEDWQDEYYIWDCAAGTGNLLAGLTNKYNIWASTLDRQDVDVMKDRIANGANLLENHVFQFDFLNDDFSKLPKELQEIINNPEKRKKLVIYINPPYVEATDGIGLGGGKKNVSKETKVYQKYGNILKKAKNELFAQFLARIYKELEGTTIAQFSTLKILQSSNFVPFRQFFQAKLKCLFVVPADTFDNVKGRFPIGFMIWDTAQKEIFSSIIASVYERKGQLIGTKNLFSHTEKDYINNWIKQYEMENGIFLGFLSYLGNDFQHINEVRISYKKPTSHISTILLNKHSLIPSYVYFATRLCMSASWLNDHDQFLYPNKNWTNDTEFQNDCFAFTLFHGQNKISHSDGINHWIPFTEYEVDAKEKFESNFMSKYIAGKLKAEEKTHLFDSKEDRKTPLVFSYEAQAVFAAGLALWKYYHAQKEVNVNASLYDIRAHFQGRNDKGKMNNKSKDETYNTLIENLRKQIELLARKIEPKVYEYGFLK